MKAWPRLNIELRLMLEWSSGPESTQSNRPTDPHIQQRRRSDLINRARETSNVPAIFYGVGNAHVYCNRLYCVSTEPPTMYYGWIDVCESRSVYALLAFCVVVAWLSVYTGSANGLQNIPSRCFANILFRRIGTLFI